MEITTAELMMEGITPEVPYLGPAGQGSSGNLHRKTKAARIIEAKFTATIESDDNVVVFAPRTLCSHKDQFARHAKVGDPHDLPFQPHQDILSPPLYIENGSPPKL